MLEKQVISTDNHDFIVELPFGQVMEVMDKL
jgi:hypothetical protein